MPGRNPSLAAPVATASPSAAGSSERLAWETAVKDPTRKLGFYLGLTYAFLRFSMLHETLTIIAHVNLYLALLTGLPAVVLSLVGGGFKRATQSRAGQFWLAFLVIFLLSLPSVRGAASRSAWRRDTVAPIFRFCSCLVGWC